MPPTETEVFERLHQLETACAVHNIEIGGMREGMVAMETRITNAGREREAHIVEKIDSQKQILERILWGIATAVAALLLNLATQWVQGVNEHKQPAPMTSVSGNQ
jgi:hypothetical protein